MSIQISRSRKLIHRIQAKLGLDSVWDRYLLKYQMHERARFTRNSSDQQILRVYYHPYSVNTHPYIKDRMYGACAPLPWSNFIDSNVSHFLQRPESVVKPYFIEPNDQILTLGRHFGAKTPFEIVKKLDDIKELIASKNFKGLLIGEDGLEAQFIHYFGSDLIHKLYKYPQMRCIPQVAPEQLTLKSDIKGLRFLFLASDFKLKAVDLLIESWINVARLNQATLTIACPSIPLTLLEKIKSIKSIKIIKQAPLSKKIKRLLLSNADISICLTHVDGGANAWEALEYGHPLILNTYHRSDYLTKNQNGVVIDFPNQFYRLGEYGYRFNSIEEYMNNVEADIRQGKYDLAQTVLTEKIQAYIDNPQLVHDHSIRSLQLADDQSVTKSNERLINIYTEGLD